MTRRALFEEAGGFSEEFPLNYNDVDYCLKLHQQGYRSVYVADAALYHYESLSKEGVGGVSPQELDRFHEKWGQRYLVDPYYNPNLSPYAPYQVAG
jgi:O-antigen biosynthesis protein